MNKYIAATLVLISLNNAFAGNSSSILNVKEEVIEEKKQTQEMEMGLVTSALLTIPVPQLHNSIIEYLWSTFDNHETFKNNLLEWKNIDSLQPKPTLPFSEEWHNGYYYGNYSPKQKTPIYFYKLKNVKNEPIVPQIKEIGFIAQGSKNSILLNINQKIVMKVETKLRDFTIDAACFSVLGQLAVVWHGKNSKFHLDLFHFNTNYKYERHYLAKLNPGDKVKGIMFSLDGTKLGYSIMKNSECGNQENFDLQNLYNQLVNSEQTTEFIEIKSKNPLTITEKAKRLGIPTDEVKALLAARRNKGKCVIQ